MDMDALPSVFALLYAISEILTATWPGRILLGMLVGSAIARVVRS
jgi:hypothetical protein